MAFQRQRGTAIMEPLQSAVNQAMETLPQSSTQSYSDSSTNEPSESRRKAREGYTCWVCKDMGWLYATDRNGEVIWDSGNRV
jgi:hypothetical protein